MDLFSSFLDSKFRTKKIFAGISRFFNYSEKEKVLKQSMQFVNHNKIEGDYYEFGVFAGSNFVLAIRFAEFVGLNDMKFHAFDSFEGLPKGDEIFQKGDCNCSKESFMNKLTKSKVNLKKVSVTKGWFDETLKEKPKGKASIIFVDVDLYESCIPVMNYITPLIQDGTIILFDDYFAYSGNPNKGERKAFEDWLKKHKEFTETHFKDFEWHGRSFVLHKRK